MLKPGDILLAADRLRGIANQTPVMTSRTLNERCGCQVFLKCENFQRVGAFKFRGAYHALSRLSQQEKEAGVIHAQRKSQGRAFGRTRDRPERERSVQRVGE